jgi:hypothetical protein
MRFILKNTDLFEMPGDDKFLHLASIGYGLREFIAFVCIRGDYKGQCYIEEVVLQSNSKKDDVTAHLKFIDDDNLAEDLMRYLEDKKLLDIPSRLNEIIDRGKSKWIM